MPFQYSAATLSRFDWLVEAVKSHNSDSCLIWPFNTENGYGQVRHEGKLWKAHRLAFKIAYGHPPTPCGLHTCDDRACFNPRHIVEDSNDDNVRDRHHKGHTANGGLLPNCKLTAADVGRIKSEYVAYHPIFGGAALARKYGVHESSITAIIRNETWKHIPRDATASGDPPAVLRYPKRVAKRRVEFHGMSGTPEWCAWQGARARCTRSSHKQFSEYGGRGIKFLFESFAQFLSVAGPRPSSRHSLDRIDNDGNYEPGNVRWATKSEQQTNRRPIKLTLADREQIALRRRNGESGRALCSEFGITIQYVYLIEKRIRLGHR